ncbi:MAG TPA: hypothetical protein VKF84_00885 [Candidatus Sulfotelmatobacter sp.]|nr:hypothetical protein [Candidatus Sulfotelmatobacter sp.]
MSDAFHSARSKIDRAKQHIAEVESIISALPNNSVATIEINPDGGNEVLKHDLRDRDKIISNLALVLGDAIHNLHCALDHAWLSVLTELCPASINNQTKFPIFPVRDKVEAALRGVKIDSAAPALFDLVLRQVKPYEGGNESLWSIHSLDIDDKHRLLLPIIEYASIHGIEVEDEQGKVVKGGTWGTSEKPPYYIPIQLGWHLKEKGTVAFSVLFDEGPMFQFADIRDMLWAFTIQVVNVIQALENVVPIELGRRVSVS